MFNQRELILKPFWDYKDIQAYFSCQKSKAFQIKDLAIKEFNGAIPHDPKFVKTEAVLKIYGIDREKEIKLLNNGKEVNEKDL